ncbi:MAG: nucleotide exchange factor GrpE [Methanothrix sp.]|jgi:molecular chaperone GrpE|nr:nucleotide exchange factor GrpE [Methanothrix sp.]
MADSQERPEDIEISPDASAKELIEEIRAAHALAEERLEQLMRCRADLDNVLKRSAREKEENVRYASEKLICKLLPVLDSLEQAALHDEGSRALLMQTQSVLSGEGLVPIVAKGMKFDPYRHEALYQVQTEELDEGTVAEEIQKGYLLGEHVIRFSKVAVAKR